MALSISTAFRKLLTYGELVTTGKLNLAQWLTLSLSGAASTAQIEDKAVTAAKVDMGGAYFQGVDTGTATAHAVAIDTNLTDYVDGVMVLYRPNVSCDGTAITLTLSGVAGAFTGGAKPLKLPQGAMPRKGDIHANFYVLARYVADFEWFYVVSILHTEQVTRCVLGASSTADALVTEQESEYFCWPTLEEAVAKLLLVTAEDVNTGAMTFNYLGIGAKALRTPADEAIAAGQVTAGMQLLLTYNADFNSAAGAWVVLSPLKQPSARVITSVRQTVLSGPVDSNGHPVLLAYTGQVVTLKATSTDPLEIAFAAGFDSQGAVDYLAELTADVASAWTIPTADATYYLFADRDSTTGAITYGYTTSRPTYINDDAAPITSGAHTFLRNRMKMYLGDGATAAEKQRVFIGECVVSGSAITSVTSYMFRGRFQSATDQAFSSASTAAATAYTETHKLGLTPRDQRWVLVCQTAELNYAIADEVPMECLTEITNARYPYKHMAANTTQMKFILAGPSATLTLVDKTAYTFSVGMTVGNWKVRAYAERGW